MALSYGDPPIGQDDDLNIPPDAGVEATIGAGPPPLPPEDAGVGATIGASPSGPRRVPAQLDESGETVQAPEVPADQPLPPRPTFLTPEQHQHGLRKLRSQSESIVGDAGELQDKLLLSGGFGDPYFWQRRERQRLADQAKLGARQAPAPQAEPNYHTPASGFEPTAAQRKLALAYQFPRDHENSMVSPSDLDQGMRDRAAQELGMPYDPSLSQAEMTALYDRANGAVRAPAGPQRDRMVAYTYEHLLTLEQQKRNRVMEMKLQTKAKNDAAAQKAQAKADAAANPALGAKEERAQHEHQAKDIAQVTKELSTTDPVTHEVTRPPMEAVLAHIDQRDLLLSRRSGRQAELAYILRRYPKGQEAPPDIQERMKQLLTNESAPGGRTPEWRRRQGLPEEE